jgi:hypothetical protein
MLQRRGRINLQAQGIAQVIAGQGEAGPEPQGWRNRSMAGSTCPGIEQGRTEVVGDLGGFRLEAERLSAAGHGPVKLPEGTVSLSQVGVERGDVGIDRDGRADELDRSPGVTSLVSHDAK